MTLIKTTPELAQALLQGGSRKIKTGTGRSVRWINLNNQTIFSEKNGSGSSKDIEDVELFICVPKGAKSVY